MTPLDKVLHLARKDATEFRWWFVGYAALALASTVAAVSVSDDTTSPMTRLLGPLLWLFGGIIVAVVVQSDSATDPRAFWAGHPISAPLLLAAKVLLLGVALIVPPLFGQLVALRHLRASSADVLAWLSNGAALYATWLLAAMLMAALTKRLAGFIGAMIAVPVLWALVGWTLSVDFSAWRVLVSDRPGRIVAATVGLAIMSVLYKTRTAGRFWLLPAGFLLSAAVTAYTSPPSATVTPIASLGAPSIALTLDTPNFGLFETANEQFVRLAVSGALPQYRYAYYPDSAILTWASGRTELLKVYPQQEFLLSAQDSTAEQNAGVHTQFTAGLAIGRARQTHDSTAGRLRSLRITGSVDVLLPQLLATIGSGDSTLFDGAVSIIVHGAPAQQASVALAKVVADGGPNHATLRLRRQYTLRRVSADQKDTVLFAFNVYGYNDYPLVLPGASLHEVQLSITPASTALIPLPMTRSVPPRPQRSETDGSRLELVRWNTISRYPVTIEHSIKAPPSPP